MLFKVNTCLINLVIYSLPPCLFLLRLPVEKDVILALTLPYSLGQVELMGQVELIQEMKSNKR